MAREQIINKVPSGRVKRTPITVRNRLTVAEQDPNYVYRFVNVVSADGNPTNSMEARLSQGYEVAPSTKVGESRVDNPSSLGSTTEVSVGKGARAVLMRIPREYYQEDQATKQASIDELESTMKSDAKRGT